MTALSKARVHIGTRARAMTRGRADWRGVLVPLALVALWSGLAGSGLVSPRLLPPPWDVITAIGEFLFAPARGVIAGVVPFEGAAVVHVPASVGRLVLSFGVAAVVGVPLGLALGLSRRFAAYVDPLVQSLRPVPIFAWLPLAFAWFGLGEGAARALIIVGALFPIVVSTADGVARVPRVYRERALALGTPRARLLWKVYLPAALPSVVTGLRLGVTLGWMSVVVGELTGTRYGVGVMMFAAREVGRLDRVIVGILCFAVLGVLSDLALRMIFRPFTGWSRA